MRSQAQNVGGTAPQQPQQLRLSGSDNSDAGQPGVSNPFDVGADGVARYFTMVQSCAMAAKLRVAGQ